MPTVSSTLIGRLAAGKENVHAPGRLAVGPVPAPVMPVVAEFGVWNLTILKVTLAAAPVLIRKPVTTPAVGENSGKGLPCAPRG